VNSHGPNRKRTQRSPVYDPYDPARIEFVRDNCISLLIERDELIERLQSEVLRLDNQVKGLRSTIKSLRDVTAT
jgi:hypothetical protein